MNTQKIMRIGFQGDRMEADMASTRSFRYSDAYSEFICGEWRSCMLWNRSCDVDDNFLEDYDLPAQRTAFGERMPYLTEVLANTFDMSRLRFARLAKLTPGSVLIPHRDYLELKGDLTRIHIPLATDNRCFSAEEDTVYQMRHGEVWFIDATRIHTAACFSSKPRIHLILDFTEAERIDEILSRPARSEGVIPEQNTVARRPLGHGEAQAWLAMSKLVDPVNYKDVFGLIIKKFFTTEIPVATVFDWLSEIARLSNNPEVVDRVRWHLEHCLIRR